ncbi:endonuclease/exonuclease/phosphatase family protein [Luteolibacter arcticus]|uniref:Endonuclease/exonuclease/phosphatase family protein n=1 Tax=Luteolibacter arcticus TaxID=1581411 RepID=A0ABT3GIA7_9BACT|nr:endonuclease/exonuclease/phosphatase family protein [Luteolibacter arcticus]MCW1923258.1 endonuclease/exonuclease/phosphatase family protein [Luteolibacter arcticus]
MNWPSFLPKPRLLVAAAASLTGSLPIIGWIGGAFFWPLDLFNHFQVQYALVLLLTTVVLLCLKSRRAAIMSAALLLVPLARIVPSHVAPDSKKPVGVPVRVASFNVFVSNDRYDDTLNWVREAAPDFIYFTETTEIWANELERLGDVYPHSIEEGTGFAFYSKLPITSHEIIRCSDIEFPLLVARITTPNGEVTVFAVHPLPPVTRHWSEALDEMMAVLAREVSRSSGPVIVAGDFNTTRWSHKSAPLQKVGLKDASHGKAPGATWMRSNSLISIPIDRLLFRGEGMHCSRFEIGPELGSDHRPLISEFAW